MGALFRFTNTELFTNNYLRQALGIFGGEDCTCVACGDGAVVEHCFDNIGQSEQSQHIGNMAAAFTDDFGKCILRMTKISDQALVSARLIERGKIFALNVFNQGNFKKLGVVQIADNDWHLMKLSPLRGSPTAFAGNYFVAIASLEMAADDNRLNNAMFANGIRESFDFVVVKSVAGLKGVRR